MTTNIYSDKKPIGKIYLTTNIVNGMQYVGQTIRLNDKSYKGSGNLIKEAFKEFGKDNFIVETLELIYDYRDINSLEVLWIEKLNTLYPM